MNYDFDKIVDGNNIYNCKDTQARSNIKTINNSISSINNDIKTINTSISSINNDIEDIENKVSNIGKKPAMILIGDSYGTGYNPDGSTTNSWAMQVDASLKFNNYTSYYKCENGIGFSTSRNFLTLLTELRNTLSTTEVEAVEKIIICGGYNDINGDVGVINTRIQDVQTYIKYNFINADLYILMISADFLNYGNQNALSNKVYNAYSSVYGVTCPESAKYVLAYPTYMSSDGFHPNQDGQNVLSKYVYAICENLTPSVNTSLTGVALNGDFINNNFVINCSVNNNLGYLEIKLNGNIKSKNIVGGQEYTLFNRTLSQYIPYRFPQFSYFNGYAILNNGSYHEVPIALYGHDTSLNIAFIAISQDGQTFASFNNVINIQCYICLNFYNL